MNREQLVEDVVKRAIELNEWRRDRDIPISELVATGSQLHNHARRVCAAVEALRAFDAAKPKAGYVEPTPAPADCKSDRAAQRDAKRRGRKP